MRRPGPFLWGPAATGWCWTGWRSAGSAPVWRPARGIETVSLAWLGANGNALAFVMPGGLNLASAALGSIDLRELTPFRGSTYLAVAGHLSGEALAFVLRREGASRSGWPATPAAARSGWSARPGPGWGRWPSRPAARPYYGARQPDGTRRLEVFSLAEGAPGPGLDGRAGRPGRRQPARPGRHPDRGRHRQRLRRPPGRPVGAGRRPGRPLLPSASWPTSAVGWLDTRQVLVVEGGCDGPFDLWLVT